MTNVAKIKEFEILCPHCEEYVIIKENEINCAIFRHAVLKSNLQQISPHATKEQCDDFLKNDLVYGCCKPFKLVKNNKNEYVAIICDYI